MPDVRVVRLTNQHPTFILRDEQGNPVDLTGGNVKYAAKRSIEDADDHLLFDLACTLGVDPTTGEYSIPLSTVQTVNPAGQYVSELRFWKNGVPTSAPPTRSEAGIFELVEKLVRTES